MPRADNDPPFAPSNLPCLARNQSVVALRQGRNRLAKASKARLVEFDLRGREAAFFIKPNTFARGRLPD